MPQAIANDGKLSNRDIKLVRPGGKHFPVDPRAAIRRKHAGHFIQRKSGRAAHGNQCEPLQNGLVENAPSTHAPDGADQSLFFVETQRRCGNPRIERHLRNVQIPAALDLKST